jgi:AraC-like DNA-binding protein
VIIKVNAPEPKDFPHLSLAGIQVIFDQSELSMLIPNEWQKAPLSIANPDISKAAVEKCEDEMKLLGASDLISKVRIHLQNLERGMPNLNEIAETFHMSAATFKRKLKEKDTNYQELKDGVRKELAIKLIKTSNHTFEDIASMLGFSDASNFTKAFKNWMGRTPRAFRDEI